MKGRTALAMALVVLVLGAATTVQGSTSPNAPPMPAGPALLRQAVAQAYAVDWWTIDGGGAFLSGGGDFELGATIGQIDANSNLEGGDLRMSTGFWTRAPGGYALYLPLVLLRVSDAPDLVVESITATADNVTIVIRNRGLSDVTQSFWVDLYVNPNPPPTAVNQTWPYLCSEGLAWSVGGLALPIGPGQTRVLTLGDPYFIPEYSHVEWPLEVGTPIYAQVDSANALTDYGAVLEDHELVGGPYNNILGPVLVAPGGQHALPGPVVSPAAPGQLPPRP